MPRSTILGFPRGAALLVVVEFWERFSFYGMLAILVLFLTDSPADGGFGWTDGAALRLLGGYSGLAFCTPIVGGILSDRYFGPVKSVVIGGALMALGHFLLIGPAPAFYAGLICLVTGTGFLKPAMLVLLGSLFAPADPRRAAAFNYYYMAINVGGLVAGLAVGGAAERLGWHYGFGLAGLGMVAGLVLFVSLAPRLLGRGEPAEIAAQTAVAASRLTRADRRRLLLIAVAALFVVLYVVGWYQGLGLWLLFIRGAIDRTVADFEVPVSWFASFNPALILLLSPIVAAIWVKLAKRGAEVHFLSKFVASFFLLATAHLTMFVAASNPGTMGGPGAGIGWPVYAYVAMTLGEVILWPTTYGMVQELAPPQLRAFLMGAWHATLGVGSWLAGLVGAQAERIGPRTTFLTIALGLAVLGTILVLLARPLRRLERGAEA